MRIFTVVVVTIVALLGVLALASYAFLKTHPFSARTKPSGLEIALARTVRSISSPNGYHSLANPVPATADALAEGRHHYSEMCTPCHATDGRGKTETAAGLYPPVPDLTSSRTQSMTDGDLYNVVKNGIPFSGMPAWDEEELTYWKIVHFIRHMPHLTGAEVEQIQTMSGLSPEHE